MIVRRPIYSFVVARTKNGVIGCENAMPWRIPSDLKNFKRLTVGRPVIMGRKTYESIGKALPHRFNIVVSRENGIRDPNVYVAYTKQLAMEKGEAMAAEMNSDQIMVIGGEAIFELFKDEVNRVYLTEIDATIENGDAYFREAFAGWHKSSIQRQCKELGDQYSYTFMQLDRPQSKSQSNVSRDRILTGCLAFT